MFGEEIVLATVTPDHIDLAVTYPGIRNLPLCRQVLEQFGKVTESAGTYYIASDETLDGYRGGISTSDTGCEPNGDRYDLNILID